MRKTFMILFLAVALSSCGGSGSETLGGISTQGNFISTTVELDQRFVYALNSGDSSVSGYIIDSGSEGSHDHTHARVQAQEHEHEGGESGDELSLRELDGSPYTFPGGSPFLGLVVDGSGRWLCLLDRQGNLSLNAIDGETGLVTPGKVTATGVSNPRQLRLSDSGDAVAVLGDSLAIYGITEEGLLPGALLQATGGWTDVSLEGARGVGATPGGAAGFAWAPGATSAPAAVALPGAVRGGLVRAATGIFVVNTEDRSLSRLDQEPTGELTLLETLPLPQELVAPSLIVALLEGQDLLVADSTTIVSLHPHDGELEEEGHTDIDQAPTILFPIPESSFVLVGHAQGQGYSVLQAADGLSVVEEAGTEQLGVSAFGFADRLERVTRTLEP